MKKCTLWTTMLILTLMVCSTSCGKRQHITVSKENLSYASQGGKDFFQIKADCDWTIEKNSSQDWYSINPTSGSNDAIVEITISPNDSHNDRSDMLTVISTNGRTKVRIPIIQTNIDINKIINKVWFTWFYERWNTDFYNNYIEESYRTWRYYAEPEYENWFFYFMNDGTGYQIRTHRNDTIYYAYNYNYFPDGDSLYINFNTTSDSISEDYHAIIYELNRERFVFLNEYRPHQFEKINTANVSTNNREEFKINPKKVALKPKGALIQVNDNAR